MDLQVPEYIRLLVPYVPGKPIEETQREYRIKRVVKLASNENPLGPSPKALQAARRALVDAHRYPDSGAFRLKQTLSRQLGVAPAQLIIGNGSNELIDLLIRTYCVAGDSIVTSRAAFIAYKICAQVHGARTEETALTPDLRFDLDAMARCVREDERARIVFIANPNNPTGTYVTTDELRLFLRRIAEIPGRTVLVALDYAYWEYVTAKDLPDPMELMREFPNVVVMRTFSKIHGLAGFRMGYSVGAPEIIASLEKVRQPFNFNSLGLAAAEAALGDREFIRRSRRINAEGMKFWEAELKRLGVPFWKSQGNFILADVASGFGKTGPEVYQECLRLGVIFRPVANYGLAHTLRISIGKPEENRIAARALSRLRLSSAGGSGAAR